MITTPLAERKVVAREKEKKDALIRQIPTIAYLVKTYGQSFEGNDQKACRIFKDYEPKEKCKRLIQELEWVKDGRVPENILDECIKKKRAVKHQSYKHWAELMLLWLAGK